tara:strand:- start:63 stop:596 length:534 start_codon:yes stop_codon:yes gene_type:complete
MIAQFLLYQFIILFIHFCIYSIVLFVKRLIFPGIIFYEGIIICLISLMIIFWFIKNYLNKSLINEYSDMILIISFFCILIFHTSVVTIVDRSISVFVLDKINDKNNTIELVQNKFIDEYVNNAIIKRFEEQYAIGNIIIDSDSTTVLSLKGKITIEIFRMINKFYLLDDKIISSGIK